MTRIILFLITLLLSNLGTAQNSQLTVKGKVVDGQDEALAFVTILVKDANGSLIVSLHTNEAGDFEIQKQENIHQVEFQYVSFLPKVFTYADGLPPIIQLEEDNHYLDDVVITAKRPTIKRHIDRLVFDVQHTALASSNAWEILKVTPGVAVIGDDIQVRSQGQVLVTINDRRVFLSGEQLKGLLEGTSGDAVESIEVITNPPAKYEAEGNAVVNIKLKKSIDLGFKGSISNRHRLSKVNRNTVGLNGYYNTNKTSTSASYSFIKGESLRDNEDIVFFPNGETWTSDMRRKNKIKGAHSFQVNTDVFVDSLFTITAGGMGYINSGIDGVYAIPTLITDSNNVLVSNYHTSNDRVTSMENVTGYLLFDRKWQGNQQLQWANYYTYDNQREGQDVFTELNFAGTPSSTQQYINKSNARIKAIASNVDYSLSGEDYTLEGGAKFSYVDGLFDLDFYDDENGDLSYVVDKSNVFTYKEINWATFFSYQRQWNKWEVKAGLRAEYTRLTLANNNLQREHKDYFKLFPTFYLTYQLTEDSKLGISYGKRIQRPNYAYLNPAKSYYNMFSYFEGDSNLKPSIRHNTNINYTWNYFTAELFYNYEKNPFMEISYQENDTHMVVYHYTNIKKRQNAGVEVSGYIPLNDWLSFNMYHLAGYQEDYFQGVDKEFYKNDAFSYGGKLYAIFNLQKESNWKAMLIYGFATPTVQGTFKVSGTQSTDITVSRDFFKSKWTIDLMLTNIFKSDIQTIKTQYADQYNLFKDYTDSRALTLGIKYNFGNQRVKASAKDINFDEKDRI